MIRILATLWVIAMWGIVFSFLYVIIKNIIWIASTCIRMIKNAGNRSIQDIYFSEVVEELQDAQWVVKVILCPLLSFFHCLLLIVSYPVRAVNECIDEDLRGRKVNFFTVSWSIIKKVLDFIEETVRTDKTGFWVVGNLFFPLTTDFIFERREWDSFYRWCLNIQIIFVLFVLDLPWFSMVMIFFAMFIVYTLLFRIFCELILETFKNFLSIAKIAMFIILSIVVIWGIAYMVAPVKTANFTYKISVAFKVSPKTIKKVAGVFTYTFGNHHSQGTNDNTYIPRKSVQPTKNHSKTFNQFKNQTVGFFKNLFGKHPTNQRHTMHWSPQTSLQTKQKNYHRTSSSSRHLSSSSNYSNTYYSTYSSIYVGEYQVYSDTQQNWLYWMNQTSKAIENGDYNRAISCAQYELRAYKDYSPLDVSEASIHLTLAMLWWSVGERSNARKEMEQMISKLQNGRYARGSGCETRAIIFLQKMRSGKLPSRFTRRDITSYLHNFIMEEPYAVLNRKLKKISAHYEAIGNMAAAATNVYRKQGLTQAMAAKHYAQSEYQKATGKRFSKDNPPAYGTKDRERWEGVKRIYDIFD